MTINFYAFLRLSAICFGLLLSSTLNAQESCPTGTDIHIANDVSGSVDSRELQQSKDFVSLLGANFGTAYGTGNLETRVSISNWSAGSGRFVEYNFPSAGQNYATSIGDILSYTTSARPFRGGTDVYTALLRAREWVNQNPVSGRDVPKIIVLLTDASCGQVKNGISTLATQIKNQGITIVLLAIDNAASCTNLSGTNIASPGGYFNAADYATLSGQAISFINDLRDATCPPVPPPAPFDLTINLSNFQIANCNTSPTASADYFISNISEGLAFNDNLQISFYNGNPRLASTQFLFTQNAGIQNIPANGGFINGSVNNTLLTSTSTLYAVVNYDGSAAGNEVPLTSSNLSNEISVASESIVNNNFSTPVTRTDGAGCEPFANIDVKVTTSGVGCDDEVIYTVQVCNTGTADALVGATDINPIAPTGFNLLSTTLVGTDPFVSSANGDTLPAGACATYRYLYDITGVSSGNYNFSVDVDASLSAPPTSTNEILTSSKAHSAASSSPNCDLVLFTEETFTSEDPSTAKIEFDLASYIGNNNVQNAALVLTMSGSASVNINNEIYFNDAPWSEGPCSGSSDPFPSFNLMGNNVAGFAVSGSDAVGTEYVIDITGLVNDWIDANIVNYGIIIEPNESSQPIGNGWRAYSDDATDQSNRPRLFLDFDGSGINTGTTAPSVPLTFSPNTNFSVGGNSGLNGFNGLVNNSDDITYSGTTTPCTGGNQLTLNASLTNTGVCQGDFNTATIEINNTSGLTLNNLDLFLFLEEGLFSGEAYGFTNGISLTEPNVFDPAYPNVPFAIDSDNEPIGIKILSLQPGISTFNLDFPTPFDLLEVGVSNIPPSVSFSVDDDINQTVNNTQPTITAPACPTSVTTSATSIVFSGYSATNASNINWTSGSNGTFSNPATLNPTYTINDTDRANGFVEFSLEVSSTAGCQELVSCRVEITGALYDYGDAPSSYDFGQDILPVAAAATINSDIYLGSTAPGSENESTPTADATGDGIEEDGLNTAVIPDVKPGQTFTLTVTATNNDTTRPAYLRAFIDWNTDGDFLGDEGEASQEVIVPANSGNSSYPVEFTVPANVSSNLSDVIVRLRLSTDEFAAARTFGASANGEVEDFQIQPNVCLPLNLKVYLAGALINNGGATGSGGEPLMRDNLRNSIFETSTTYLPTLEPYTALAGFTHVGSGGGEEATATAFDDRGQNSVVDWVFVEFRDKNDNTVVLETMSALVQRDGDVVGVDGVTPIQLCTTESEYFVAVRHRNHFGVMTASAENLRTDSTVDFSDNNAGGSGVFNYGTSHPVGGPAGFDYTGLSQQSSYLFTPFPSGISALWLGNAVVGNKIKYESPNDDNSQIFEDVLLFPGNSSFLDNYDFAFSYVSGDLDMNGKVKYEAPNDDQNILADQILSYPLNLSFVFNFDFLFEQLP